MQVSTFDTVRGSPMPDMLGWNADALSLIYGIGALTVLLRLSRGWRSFRDDRITPEDRRLAWAVAFFLLLPIGVLLHELAHALATWQTGGRVLDFQWRVYWGYVVSAGRFTPLQRWWIALSGNLVSVLVGLLAIAFAGRVRNVVAVEVLRAFAQLQLFHVLVFYPVFSFATQQGDWQRIYDFSVPPAYGVLLIHVALLTALWRLRIHLPRH
jgi:hypothetical protein